MDRELSIQEKIKGIQSQISAHANPAFCKPNLIAVSKTKPVEMILEAYKTGIRDFGENKVQEILSKYDQCPSDIRWHMIGHLQTNKVKYIIDKVCMIHSVESYNLAAVIDKEAKKKNLIMPVLIEINIGNEESKFGISPKEAPDFVKSLLVFDNLKVMGLMCVAPYVENPEENRQHFVTMRQLSVDIARENADNISSGRMSMDILSMGMSNDYLIAVEEGSGYVRVGTGIFGERQYSI